MNVIARLEYELAYYDSAVHRFNHYTTRTPKLLNGETKSFDIVAEVLQEDMLAPFLFIIWLDSVLQTSIDLIKENCFILKKTRSR